VFCGYDGDGQEGERDMSRSLEGHGHHGEEDREESGDPLPLTPDESQNRRDRQKQIENAPLLAQHQRLPLGDVRSRTERRSVQERQQLDAERIQACGEEAHDDGADDRGRRAPSARLCA
jgi:hypothetical protein